MLKTQQQHAPALTEIGTAVRHSAVYGLGSILTKALQFRPATVLHALLGPSPIMVLSRFWTSSVSLLAMVLNMGIANALLRTYAASASSASEKDKAVSTAFLFAGAVSGLVIFFSAGLPSFGLYPPCCHELWSQCVPRYGTTYCIRFPHSSRSTRHESLFRSTCAPERPPGWTVLLDSIFTLLVLVLNIFFLAGLKIGLFGILLSPVIVNGALLCLAGGAMLRLGLRFNGSLLREMVRFGLPLIFASLAAFRHEFLRSFFPEAFSIA